MPNSRGPVAANLPKQALCEVIVSWVATASLSTVEFDDRDAESRPRRSLSETTQIPNQVMSSANVHKSIHKRHENGPRSVLRGPFYLVAGTGFEPATSGL